MEEADEESLEPSDCGRIWLLDADDGAAPEDCLSEEHSHHHPPEVFTTIHRVRQLVLKSIDDPYTLSQLTSPRVNTLVVRPLVDRLYDPDDSSIGSPASPFPLVSSACAASGAGPGYKGYTPSSLQLVYCLLANRVQFLREQSAVVHHSVNITRAALCEIVATRILRKFHEENPGSLGLLVLAGVLVEGFDPFSGAPEDVERSGRYLQWPVQERGGHERKLTALELAILSESKIFISSQACQRVVNAVYQGQVTYTPLSFVDILPDHYKYRPISLYDPRRAPLLNHYRLIVPRSRNVIETAQFMILVALYVLAMVNRNNSSPDRYEALFIIYTAGWVLDEFAAIIEHGWAVHAQSLWSFLDITFTLNFGAYLFARFYDLSLGTGDGSIAFPLLCLAAPILLTRMAFNLMPDNIVFISLHAMMKGFLMLTFLAVWCVTGFFLALQWLVTEDDIDTEPKWYTITKWLLWIWFGLDGTGIEESVRFHTVLGPALMVSFAFLGNTLFLTILVALLTNTFSRIVEAETAEIQFRRAVLTFEGVKSDAIFAYPPPFNIVALMILLPLKFVVSPRAFHRIHVAMVRGVNAPTLLIINLYERQFIWARTTKASKSFLKWQFTGFSPHGDIYAVFEADPPPGVQEEAETLDGLSEMGFSDNDRIPRAREAPQPTDDTTVEAPTSSILLYILPHVSPRNFLVIPKNPLPCLAFVINPSPKHPTAIEVLQYLTPRLHNPPRRITDNGKADPSPSPVLPHRSLALFSSSPRRPVTLRSASADATPENRATAATVRTAAMRMKESPFPVPDSAMERVVVKLERDSCS
ncbi:related to YVC1 Vacuolar cation channel [Cephalotrichum gorgonifer]|uniref:Related to YVC1 Vacuolar cation channel n=1 Tax=Cephalotrichum gorgonifer TaxID=2041049 RepID=A0AAE8N0L6_9PEZI|nr:related to YVC1 Vacuolar cation channel [Cephalotrichum gorgonifer]